MHPVVAGDRFTWGARPLSNPLRHDLLRTPAEAFEDGLMVVPKMPGIGAGIDEDVLDNHRVT